MVSMIVLLEKILVGLTVLSVLFVVGTVTFFTAFMPPRSGIPAVVEKSLEDTSDWLEQQRARWAPRSSAPRVRDFGVQVELAEPATPQPKPRNAAEKKEVARKARKEYWAGEEKIPPAEQVRGIPWLRKIPGVKYAKLKKVPEILYRRYQQSYEETMALAKQGGGHFVETDAGPAYEIKWLNDKSLLYRRLGLRPGDRVISVNGQPVGRSPAAGQALFEQLRNERNFSVLIERRKQQLVLSYTVGQ
ncbi:MAG: hypothetical protein D6731_18820 [Planctomycetota bacterium]|nr:MAG: hypothetical protein D6731_18820 [Planctomycetota bacterium]